MIVENQDPTFLIEGNGLAAMLLANRWACKVVRAHVVQVARAYEKH